MLLRIVACRVSVPNFNNSEWPEQLQTGQTRELKDITDITTDNVVIHA